MEATISVWIDVGLCVSSVESFSLHGSVRTAELLLSFRLGRKVPFLVLELSSCKWGLTAHMYMPQQHYMTCTNIYDAYTRHLFRSCVIAACSSQCTIGEVYHDCIFGL